MFDHIATIINLVVESFLHVWPYLLVTIPLSVAVRMSGASRYISRALTAQPILAILLATVVGAFSPFCSCGVVPIVAALLIGGVPLAPVMTFWIASPSMDPEIFFMSVATIGWELAGWRLGGTLALSMSAGFLTHFLVGRGWLGRQYLRAQRTPAERTVSMQLQGGWQWLKRSLAAWMPAGSLLGGPELAGAAACCSTEESGSRQHLHLLVAGANPARPGTSAGCDRAEGSGCTAGLAPFWRRLLDETWSATAMVVKFMLLAFFLNALIQLHVPADWVAGLLGDRNAWAIPVAALIGVPAYSSNLTALPLVGGLMAQGMNPSAALAFLVAGPTTTLPAMAAVSGLAARRVFALYVSLALVGAVALGYLHRLVTALL